MDPRASAILNAYDNGGQLAPLSDTAGLDIDEAYGISGEIHAARLARGEVVRGRKIGFTNRSIWEKYGVDAPMWSYIYDTTYNELGDDGVIALPPQAEPRLEPEIALCFKATPTADMSVAEIANCIAWVSHSIEIVASPFPGWNFTIADCVAAQALHASFWCGSKIDAAQVFADGVGVLEEFSLCLTGPGVERTGHATDVLGGPLHALKFLLAEIPRMPGALPIEPGEVIATGTLTDGHPVAAGEVWTSSPSGIDLPGLSIRIA